MRSKKILNKELKRLSTEKATAGTLSFSHQFSGRFFGSRFHDKKVGVIAGEGKMFPGRTTMGIFFPLTGSRLLTLFTDLL